MELCSNKIKSMNVENTQRILYKRKEVEVCDFSMLCKEVQQEGVI